MRKLSMLLLFFLLTTLVNAQTYSIVIKGGHIIDPKNKTDEVMDIGISDGKIAKIAQNIDAKQGIQVVQAQGLYVTPGLVDIHVHFFWGTDMKGMYRNGPNGLQADGFTFRSGVTTVVDAGSSGWRNFSAFKKQTIDISKTRVLSMLNIVGEGMAGGKYEQDQDDMDAVKTAEVAKQYPNDIVGIKLAHFNGNDWTPTDRALEAAKLANLPVMIDFGGATPALSLKELFLNKFRPGDIYTHCFGGNFIDSKDGRENIVDIVSGQIKPFVIEAQKRGVIFDVGFGGSSFLFHQGLPAIKSGFYPNSISTDLHTGSMNNAMKDMPNIMSLFMAMGMSFNDVITASTWNPAKEIQREDLGNLSIGSVADIAIFNLREGKFGYYARDGKIAGDKKLETEMTIREGVIVYNLNAIADPLFPPAKKRN